MAHKVIVRWRLGFCGLERFEFVGETPAWYIRANGQKEKKVSRMGRYYETEVEALRIILETARENVKHYEKALAESKDDLRKARVAVDRAERIQRLNRLPRKVQQAMIEKIVENTTGKGINR